MAAGARDDPRPWVTDVLSARGWRHQDGTDRAPRTVSHLLRDNFEVLRRLGAITSGAREAWPGRPTPEGRAFARAALASETMLWVLILSFPIA